ncbi:MFS multidrug transporter [Protomyces lactucae-debilis]|uniref:MFS multidrug transporter n=1 Tax=Protomyces lactucae-debilis TaxID=2754530 RepID=A0A1Y2F594_PROLT|nr:MFS multidrug transporter [Protomyces lactucae-debilis]ORY78516.1 MFS multidrug transporter [Protomyces lactucae-debilis]
MSEVKLLFNSISRKFTREPAYDVQKLQGKRRTITKSECRHLFAYEWSSWKKWTVLTVIFVVQLSMNFNASSVGNAVTGISDEYGVSLPAARLAQSLFLIAYGIGSELWAPWSEGLLGRWQVLQGSLFLVNVWDILVAASPNFASVVIGRILGGASSAGGSVTLGIVNDLYHVDVHGYALNYVVLSSVSGSVLGPVVGGFIEANLNWRWVFWVQLIFGGVTQLMHALLVPETNPTVLMDREARRRRTENNENIWGPSEETTLDFKEIRRIWARPFIMFATEPVVGLLCLLSGFSDSLIFTFIEGFRPVTAQYGFSIIQNGLFFISLLVGYLIAYIYFLPFVSHDIKKRKASPGKIKPETRLDGLLWVVPLLPAGLFFFSWSSLGPAYVPWIVPAIAAVLIGVANSAIYMATIDYLVVLYGSYSASATGGNALARDVLAGVAAFYSAPFFAYFERNTLEYPTTILACIAVVLVIPVYVFYFNGEYFCRHSKFAQQLAKDEAAEADASSASDGKMSDRESAKDDATLHGGSASHQEKV